MGEDAAEKAGLSLYPAAERWSSTLRRGEGQVHGMREGACAAGPGPQTRVGQKLQQQGETAMVGFMRRFRLSPECRSAEVRVARLSLMGRSKRGVT